MFYKVFLCIFLTSIMTLIMWMLFTIKISNSDYKIEPVIYRRYLEAVVNNQRPEVRRNDTFLQRGIKRIAIGLKREFSSIKIYLCTQMQIYLLRLWVAKISEFLLHPSGRCNADTGEWPGQEHPYRNLLQKWILLSWRAPESVPGHLLLLWTPPLLLPEDDPGGFPSDPIQMSVWGQQSWLPRTRQGQEKLISSLPS